MSTSDHLDRIKIKPRQIVMKVSKHKSERSIKEEKHESPKSENNFDIGNVFMASRVLKLIDICKTHNFM